MSGIVPWLCTSGFSLWLWSGDMFFQVHMHSLQHGVTHLLFAEGSSASAWWGVPHRVCTARLCLPRMWCVYLWVNPLYSEHRTVCVAIMKRKREKKCNVVFTVSKKVLPLIDCLLYSEIITLIVSAVVLLTSWYVPTRATVFSFWSCIVCVCGFCTINLTVYTHCDSVAGLCFPNQVSLYQHLFATCLHFSRCVTLKCPICRQFHPTLDVLEEHLTTFHPNQKRYQCLLCRRKYHTHFSFLHHIPQVHKNLDSRAAAEASIDDPEPPDLSFESENHNLPQNF